MRNAETSFLLLEEGRKTEALDVSTHCGGGAVNAAVALARLGHDVSAMVRLGQDPRADIILTRLEAERISTRWAVRDPVQKTGASLIIASHERNAGIFAFRGANTGFRSDALNPSAFETDLCLVSSLSNESAECFPDIVRLANAAGAVVAANPGIRQLSARGGAFQRSLGDIDLLSVNRAEGDALTPALVDRFGEGGRAFQEDSGSLHARLARGFEGGGYYMSTRHFFRSLLDCGPRWIVLTDGTHGAFLATGDTLYHCPVAPVEVVGTAGAGDAFYATVASELANGVEPEAAMRSAAVNAAAVVRHVDTQTGLLDHAALTARLKEVEADLTVRTFEL
ncbi:MAG: carbohydrate kinase family protein [Minwuia sp.]|uniref:carbohydrate kinase family protein n=1 Tax=Minwuia sp. TaxID=2493630 RepID=UPI003A88B6DB